jgi:hypothetical protein|nr:hypothetical protein [uncultured Treponema sp.]
MKKLLFVLAAVTAVSVITGCESSPDTQADRARERALNALKPYKTEPAQRPSWIDNVPHTKTELVFVGLSTKWATEAEAKDKAQENGRNQLVKYYGTLITAQGRTAKATYGISSDVFAPQQVSQELEEYVAKSLSKKLAAYSFYVESYLTKDMEESHIAYALMKIDKSDANKAMEEYCDDKADDARKKAAAEKDAERKKQLEKAADFFGGQLKSSLTE